MKVLKALVVAWLFYISIAVNFAIGFNPFGIYITEDNPYIFIARIVTFCLMTFVIYFKDEERIK